MNDKEHRDRLQAEYLHLQGVIESFDGKALKIKTWSISFSLAAIGAAFAANSAPILIVASGSALVFWYLEGQWKTFQYAYYDRIGDIEGYFEGKGKPPAAMQIGESWYKRWKSGGTRRLLRIMIWPHVMLPHLLVVATGVVLYVLVLLEFVAI